MLSFLSNKYTPSYRDSITSRVPQWAVRDGVVFSRKNVLEFGIEYRPPSGIDVTDAVRTGLAESLRNVLTAALPERCRARIIVECQKMSADQLMEPAYEQVTENALMGELGEQEQEQLREQRLTGGMRSWRYFFLVRMPPPPFSFFANLLKRGPTPYTEETLLPHLTRAQLTRSHIMSVLDASGFDCVAMDSQQAFELMWRYYNPDLATSSAPTYVGEAIPPNMSQKELERRPEVMTRTLAEQITESDYDTSGYNKVVMGSKEVFTVNIRGVGTVTYPGMIEPLLAAMSAYSYYYVLDCVHEDQIDQRKKLENSAMDARNAATDTSSALGGSPDVGNEALYQGMRETLYTMTAEQEQVFRFGLTVVIICDDKYQREEATEVCRSKLAQMGGAAALIGTVQNVPQIIENVSPFSGNDNYFLFRVMSRNAADMLPLVSPYTGSAQPIMVLSSRMGTQVGLNPKDDTDNYGTLVIGKSGSGKTMVVQKLMLSCRRAGADLIIVDQKNDYLTLVDTMEGQFINFTPGEVYRRPSNDGWTEVPVRYNAFEFPEDGNMEDHKRFVMGFLAVLLREPINGEAESILTYALEDMYAVARGQGRGRTEPTLSKFIDTLSNLNRIGNEAMSSYLRDIAQKLRVSLLRYAGNTAMGRFLDGPSTIDLTSEVIYFNIFAIREDETLKPIALMLITRLIWKRAVRDTKVKVMLVEELGVLLQIPEAARFVNALFKLGRTYNLWPIAVSQEVKDFDSAGGLINNMSQVIVGSLTPSESRKLVEILELDPEVATLIDRLSGVRGISKEYLLLRFTSRGRSGDVVVYRPTRGEYWTFTSAPDDRAVRDRAIALNGGNRVAAIRSLSRVVAV